MLRVALRAGGRGTVARPRHRVARHRVLRQAQGPGGADAPRGPVTANEEIQLLQPGSHGGGRAHLPVSRLTSRQIMLVGGPQPAGAKRYVHSPTSSWSPPTSRATPGRPRGEHHVPRHRPGAPLPGEEGRGAVVQEHPVTRAKALALGVTFDPPSTTPAHRGHQLSLRFEFLGKDPSLARASSAVLGLAKPPRPKAIGDKVDLSASTCSPMRVPVIDQLFATQGEVEGARLRDRPFSTGLNPGYQLTSFQKLCSTTSSAYEPTRPTTKPRLLHRARGHRHERPGPRYDIGAGVMPWS